MKKKHASKRVKIDQGRCRSFCGQPPCRVSPDLAAGITSFMLGPFATVMEELRAVLAGLRRANQGRLSCAADSIDGLMGDAETAIALLDLISRSVVQEGETPGNANAQNRCLSDLIQNSLGGAGMLMSSILNQCRSEGVNIAELEEALKKMQSDLAKLIASPGEAAPDPQAGHMELFDN